MIVPAKTNHLQRIGAYCALTAEQCKLPARAPEKKGEKKTQPPAIGGGAIPSGNPQPAPVIQGRN